MILKEIIFENYNTQFREFRVVCQYGNMFIHPTAWQFLIQEKTEKKRWFKKPKTHWDKVDTRWCEVEIETREELKKYADKAFDSAILEPMKKLIKAISI